MKNQKNQPLRVKRQLTKEELDAIYQYADSMGMGTSEGLESGLASDDITFMESISGNDMTWNVDGTCYCTIKYRETKDVFNPVEVLVVSVSVSIDIRGNSGKGNVNGHDVMMRGSFFSGSSSRAQIDGNSFDVVFEKVPFYIDMSTDEMDENGYPVIIPSFKTTCDVSVQGEISYDVDFRKMHFEKLNVEPKTISF